MQGIDAMLYFHSQIRVNFVDIYPIEIECGTKFDNMLLILLIFTLLIYIDIDIGMNTII